MAMELTRINPDQQRAARALLSVRGTNLTETAQSAPARWARETRAWSRFRKFENQKCLRPPLREDDRENNSAHSWLVHVFTQPGSKPEKLAMSTCFPLYPCRQTLRYALGMSVSCHEETHAPQHSGRNSAPVLLTSNLSASSTVCRSSLNSLPTTCWTAKCAISGNSPFLFNSP